MRAVQSALAVVLCVAAAGCDRVRTPPYDLVEAFPLAEVSAETSTIDVGSAAGRQHLVSGWGHDESAGGVSYAWGLGESSELRWYLARPVDVELGWSSWSYDTGRAETVTVMVNGREVGSVEVGTNIGYYRLPIAAAHFVAGWNDVQMRYSHRNHGAPGLRPLTVAWNGLTLGNVVAASSRPHVVRSEDAPALVLPPGTQIDYFLSVPPQTTLEIDRIERNDGTLVEPLHAGLEVEFEPQGGSAVRVAAAAAEGERLTVPLPVDKETIARVSLRLPRRSESNGDGTLVLLRPRLRSATALGLPSISPAEPVEHRPAQRKPNVIVYLVDTLRADHLGCYGYPRDTSPYLDRFAADAVVFERTMAQSSWTRASVASIFTGLSAQRHGANGRRDALSAEAMTLAELLGAHGYETAALVTNANVAAQLGFAQGFESYELLYSGPGRAHDSRAVTRRTLDWLKARRDPRPFFLYVHTVDPHAPYDPPQPYRGRFAASVSDPMIGSMPMMRTIEGPVGSPVDEEIRRQLVDLYDAEIAANDASFGALVDGLVELGLYEDALVVFVSDHGEEFFDHGWWEHGDTLYEEQLFVPLLIKFPGRGMAGRRTDIVGCHIDILPTILASAGAAIPSGIDGRSLLPYLDGHVDTRRGATAYLDLDGNQLETIVIGGSKLIRNRGEPLFPPRPPLELFDLAHDPGEQRNLAFERAVAAGYLQSLLRSTAAEGGPTLSAAATNLPAHVQEQLRALGYAP